MRVKVQVETEEPAWPGVTSTREAVVIIDRPTLMRAINTYGPEDTDEAEALLGTIVYINGKPHGFEDISPSWKNPYHVRDEEGDSLLVDEFSTKP